MGAVAGAAVALVVFGVLRYEPPLDGSGRFLVRWCVAPVLPASGAFLAAMCSHRGPRGWPFVRAGAAVGAYVPAMYLALAGYDAIGVYAPYATATSLATYVGVPLAATVLLASLLTAAVHRRAAASATIPAASHRDRLWKVLGYHALAIGLGALVVVQSFRMAGRGGLFILLPLPVLGLLFAGGSLYLFLAPFAATTEALRSDLGAGAALHGVPLLLMELWAAYVLAAFVLRGNYTWTDPYTQRSFTDYTLVATPILGLALLGYLVLFLVPLWRALRRPPFGPILP